MSYKLILSEKFKEKISSNESLMLLSSKGIDSLSEYESRLIEIIKFKNSKLVIDEIVYSDEKLDKYSGYIINNLDEKIVYIFIVPPKLGTRSGFITQQVFGTLSNSTKNIYNSSSYYLSEVPVYIINSDVEDINLSKARNIVASKLLGFKFLDFYDRNEEEVLLEKFGKTNFTSLKEFTTLISDDDGNNNYYEIDEDEQIVKFKTDQLKFLSSSLTNEPYYFAIKAYPALYLASKENFNIDLEAFDLWHTSGENSNKNVEAFYLQAKKLINQKQISFQKIYYGAPGTGKSFKIDKILKDSSTNEDQIFRTTFHPEFSYSDFIGQLLPSIEENGVGDKIISYSFKKGVFTQSLEKAYMDTSKDVYLILEEMSRGDVAAIFGDVFQLLDRQQKGLKHGYSRYFVNNDVIAKDIIPIIGDKIMLPPNLYIYGTVNTSDQNVFVMDTAFKRRFEWEYILTRPVKKNDTEYLNNSLLKITDSFGERKEFEWVKFYMALNKFISNKSFLDLGEDKQIGQFFIEFDAEGDSVKNKIQNKLLQFLWSDVNKASFKRNLSLFSDEVDSFSDLYMMFEKDECIFSEEFITCLKDTLD